MQSNKPNEDLNDAYPTANQTTRIDEYLGDPELAEAKAAEQMLEDDEGIVPWVIELRIIGTPDIITAPIGERLLLGRRDDAHELYPEIDFTPYGGRVRGVSRRHARMIMRDNRLTVEDLGSANGTYVNGKALKPMEPVRLRDGDHMKLGAVDLQVHFIIKPSVTDDTMHGAGNEWAVPHLVAGKRLLIVDDNPSACAVMRYVALRAGFTATVAHDIPTAIQHFDSGGYDALVLELLIENGNSLDLLDYVQYKTGQDIPIITTTSMSGSMRENQARAKGVKIMLSKPLAVESFVGALRQIANVLSH